MNRWGQAFAGGFAVLGLILGAASAQVTSSQVPVSGKIVQYGEMHAAIGQGQDEGRIRLGELTKKEGFYAVAALAGLEGEVTICDGEITATGVDENGNLEPASGDPAELQATLLVGAYVPEWTEIKVVKDVMPEDFDAFIAAAAEKAGVKNDQPFLFKITGQFTNVRMHVINGACPIRARIKNETLPKEVQPFEKMMSKTEGTVVGVFAKDAVGKLTHPATMTHAHVLVSDPRLGGTVTGHVEGIGVRQGSVMMLPKL